MLSSSTRHTSFRTTAAAIALGMTTTACMAARVPVAEPVHASTAAYAEAHASQRGHEGEEAHASSRMSADRPGVLVKPSIVAAGGVQVEGGYHAAREHSDREQAIGELLLRVPVSRRAEFRVSGNSYVLHGTGEHREGAFEDATVGAKLRLVDGEHGVHPLHPSAALVVSTTLPTGSETLRHETAEPTATLSLEWELSERVALLGNAGYGSRTEHEHRYGSYNTGAALELALSRRVGTYLDYSEHRLRASGEPTERLVGTGLTLRLTNALQLDSWVDVHPARHEPDYAFGIGIARRW